MSNMDFWVFTHSNARLEHWLERYRERFDAWEEGGVSGIVVGYLRFQESDGPAPVFAPDPKVYEERGELPPEVERRNPEKEKQLRAMLDDAAGRGWRIMTFGGATSPAALQDLANALPQVQGVISDGPGENHYELAFHHGSELLELQKDQRTSLEPAGADPDRVQRGVEHLRRRLHNLTPDLVRYHGAGGTLAGLQLFDINEDVLHWLRARQARSRQIWKSLRESVDSVDRKLQLGGIPRTAAFSSLTGQNYQQMPQYFDILFPKHYYWHRGYDGMYGTIARWVQRLQKWNPTLTEPDCFSVVESLFGIKLPGVQSLMDMEMGFPDEFFTDVVYAETKRALEAIGDLDKVICWVSTGRSPHAGDAMTARDLHGILTASQQAGLKRFLFHPDPDLGAPEWLVLSGMCGNLWKEDPDGPYWPSDTLKPDNFSNRKPTYED